MGKSGKIRGGLRFASECVANKTMIHASGRLLPVKLDSCVPGGNHQPGYLILWICLCGNSFITLKPHDA